MCDSSCEDDEKDDVPLYDFHARCTLDEMELVERVFLNLRQQTGHARKGELLAELAAMWVDRNYNNKLAS